MASASGWIEKKMDESEKAELLELVRAMGNVSEMVEAEDWFVAETEDALSSSMGGTGITTVWAEEGNRILNLRRRKVVVAGNGRIVRDPDSIEGLCMVCREEGARAAMVFREDAATCVRCGRLLCPDRQVRVGDTVYCPAHGKWPRIKRILLG